MLEVKYNSITMDKHPTKILYIITKSFWGGGAKYVYDLSHNLKKEGFDISVAAGGQDKLAKKLKQEKAPYFEIKSFQRNVSFLKDFAAFFEILKLLFKIKPNIIHANSPKAGGIVGATAFIYKLYNLINPHLISPLLRGKNKGERAPLKTVYTPHGWAFSEDRPGWQIFLIKLFSKVTCLFYDKIICVSKYGKELAIKYDIAPNKKLRVVYTAIDVEGIAFLSSEEAKKALGLGYRTLDEIVIGTIAELTKNKGLVYLLEAFQVLQRQKNVGGRTSDIKLVIIAGGECPDKKNIKDFIRNNSIENVHIIDNLPNAASYLKAFDVFVLPSIKEGLPYSIIEAMAAGLPIVATNVGGIPELLKKNSGIMVQPKSSQELATKINFLLDDRKESRKIGLQARKMVKIKFSLNRMLNKTKKLYRI